MSVDRRRAELLEVVRQRGFAALHELSERLGVSESTVRRDLDHLERAGRVKRTHGGVFYTGPSPTLDHFDRRQSQHWERKSAIATTAARLIDDGDTVLLDGGSTTYELARQLVGRPMQVITNSLPVANLFTSTDTVDLVVVGGYLHGRTGVFLGPYANRMLAELNVHRAVLSVAGVNQRGFYNSNLLLVETERQMMESADEVIVVADSTKFGRSSLARLCGLESVDAVVVDEGLDRAWLERLEAAGVRVVLARVEPREVEGESRESDRVSPPSAVRAPHIKTDAANRAAQRRERVRDDD